MSHDGDAGGRTRGHRKKERTYRSLLDAAVPALWEKGAALTARDVTDRADFAVGTFYNYFTDVDDLIDAVTRDQLLLAADATAAASIPDPALRIAVTATRILQQVSADPQWGWLALRLVGRPGQPNHLNGHLRDDLVEGRTSGRFDRGADDTTLDQLTGLVVMTIRRMVAGEVGPDTIGRTVVRLLETVGIPEADAAELATEARSLLAARVTASTIGTKKEGS